MELLAAVIGAAFGAAFAYVGTLLQQDRDRRRSRTSMATILLSEVRAADATLRGIYEHPTRGVLAPGTFELLTSGSREALALFQPTTVQRLLALGSHLRNVHERLERIQDNSSPTAARAFHAGGLTAVAYAALAGIPELKQSLEREGGTYIPVPVPPLPRLNPGDTKPPALPSSPFK